MKYICKLSLKPLTIFHSSSLQNFQNIPWPKSTHIHSFSTYLLGNRFMVTTLLGSKGYDDEKIAMIPSLQDN